MLSKRILPFLLFALSACVTAGGGRPLGVQEVVRQAPGLDGREIAVRGWIEECSRLSCALYNSDREDGGGRPYFLSIGPSPWLDAFAARHAPTAVTLRARLHDRCISDPATGAIAVCADRPNTLEPIALLR
jgi:hypothetical protein